MPGISAGPEQAAALERTAKLLTELGHDVAEAELRYPDPTPALVPQVYRGVYEEARKMEHPERFEQRTKIEARVGRVISRRGAEAAIRYGAWVDRRATGSSPITICC